MGQGDVEHLTALPGRLGPDPAAKHLDEVLGDGKSQAETTRLAWAGTVHLVEPLEDAAPVLRRDARTTISNAQHELLASGLGLNVDRRAGRRELGGIVQQVAQRLSEFRPICRN